MSRIHPTAWVHPQAQLGSGVQVGAQAQIGARTEIGAGCVIGTGCVLHPGVVLGEECELSEYVVLGGVPQDLGFDPEAPTGVVIGPRCRLREFVTVHRATGEQGRTRLGAECYLMTSAHVGHDCVLEDKVVLASGVLLAGHVEVGAQAFVSGHVAIHQHVRIGRLSMIGGLVPVSRDVPPYSMLGREPVALYGLNRVGLVRAGVKDVRYREIARAWRAMRDGVPASEIPGESEEVEHLRSWLSAVGRRGCMPFRDAGTEDRRESPC